jgi:nucleotide-binding universal stress UspA family protein
MIMVGQAVTGTSRGPRDAIVVGVDSSADSDRAVVWALALAQRNGAPVHLVHVQPAPPETVTDTYVRRRWAEAGRLVLDNAALAAGTVDGVTVSTQSIEDTRMTITEALVEASRRAALLVVGARGHGGYAGLLTGSVSQHASRHATCPVITVREPIDAESRRVVVGVDRSDGAQAALRLAFTLASDLGAALTVIHAWRAPALHGAGSAVLPMPPDAPRALVEQQEHLLEQLAPWRVKFPDVPVVPEVIPGHAARVLTDASEHAALAVVGSRGHGAFAELLLGSVGQAVLQHARCPVAVAR